MVQTFTKPERWNVNPGFLAPEALRLWQGLKLLVPAWEGGGRPVEIIRNFAMPFNGGQEWAYGPRGVSLYSDDLFTTEGGWTIQGSGGALVLDVTHSVTVIIHKRKRDGSNRASAGFGVVKNEGATAHETDRCGAHLPYSDGTVYWDFGGFTGGTSRLSVGGLSFGDDIWCFNAGYRGMEIWQNGVRVASQSGHATRVDGTSGWFFLGNGNVRDLDDQLADNAEYTFFALWDRQLDIEDCRKLTLDPWSLIRYAPQTTRKVPALVASAAITGTAGDGATESEIVAGGETIIITLTNDTWVASGATFDAIRQDIIDGLDSAQSELTGWNNEVRDNLATTTVVRTSDTVVTITLSAQAAYNITATETITVTVPATAVVGGNAITASPTFNVTAVGAGVPIAAKSYYYHAVGGMR